MKQKTENIIQVSIMDLEALSNIECANVETLYIHDPEKVIISPHVINSEIIAREEKYTIKLKHLKKFKTLKHLYFLNIHMNNIPNEIFVLKGLQELQFNFLNNFIPEKQVQRLHQFKKLKTLIINQDFIGDESFEIIRVGLSKIKVDVVSS